MIAWWWLLVLTAVSGLSLLMMLWFFGRRAQRYVEAAVTEHDLLREQLRAANTVVAEQLETIYTQNQLIAGHTQWAATQRVSKMLVDHAVDSTWVLAEAQKAIRDRVGRHVGGLVHIEESDDPMRREIIFTGSIRLRDILDSLALVEGIVKESDKGFDRKED